MKTQHKCMTLATSFPTPDAQPPPRLRATHVRSLRWLDCPECDSIYPPPCYTAVNHYHSRYEGDLAGHFCSMSGAKCPISEWSSGGNLRAFKARLPVFCRSGFQARHLVGRFCSMSGAKCPISKWSSGEKRRASKARLHGVLQARLSNTPPGSRPLRATPLGTPRREPSKGLRALHPTCADPYQIHNCRSWHAQGASHQGQF